MVHSFNFSGFGFEEIFGTTENYKLDIYIGDAIVQSQEMQMNQMQLQQQFTQLAMQIAQEPRPMKFRFSTPYHKWDGSILHHDYIEFKNKLMGEDKDETEV